MISVAPDLGSSSPEISRIWGDLPDLGSSSPGQAEDAAILLRAWLIYVGASFLFVALGFARLVLTPLASVRASGRMHGDMTHRVFRATIGWFQATPVGRILNRFAGDVATIDQQVGMESEHASA